MGVELEATLKAEHNRSAFLSHVAQRGAHPLLVLPGKATYQDPSRHIGSFVRGEVLCNLSRPLMNRNVEKIRG